MKHRVATMAVLLATVTVIGCGKEPGDESTPTKSATETLVGTWTMTMEPDEEKLKELLKRVAPKKKDGSAPTDDELKPVLEFSKNALKRMTWLLTLNADGTSSSTITSPGPFKTGKSEEKKESGTWEVVKEDGKNITLKMTPTDGTDTGKEVEVTISLENETTFILIDSTKKGMRSKDMPGKMTFTKQ